MRAHEREKLHNPNLATPPRHPIFLALGNITAEQHVLGTLQKIPSPALHDALLVIPFSTLPTLFTFSLPTRSSFGVSKSRKGKKM